MSRSSLIFERWPRFAHRHAGLVLTGAVAILVPLAVLWSLAAGEYGSSFSVPGSEAQQLFDALRNRFPSNAGDQVTVVVKPAAGLNDAGMKAQVETLRKDLTALPEVVSVSSPFESPGAISQDRRIGRIIVQYDKQASQVDKSAAPALIDLMKRESVPGFQVEAEGAVVRLAEREPPGSSELIGISAAIIILLLAFGSIVAMGLPIVTALIGLSSGFFLIGLASRFINMPSFAPQFIAMIGIGVGIDYALLVVSRYREEVGRGSSREDATARAISTAGRSVFLAGGTVVIALLGYAERSTPADVRHRGDRLAGDGRRCCRRNYGRRCGLGTAGAASVRRAIPGPLANAGRRRPFGGQHLGHSVSVEPARAALPAGLPGRIARSSSSARRPGARSTARYVGLRQQSHDFHLSPRLRPDNGGFRAGRERPRACRADHRQP